MLLATVSSKTTVSCETHPIWSRHEARSTSSWGTPSISTVPVRGFSISVSRSTRVDLPAPDRPRTPPSCWRARRCSRLAARRRPFRCKRCGRAAARCPPGAGRLPAVQKANRLHRGQRAHRVRVGGVLRHVERNRFGAARQSPICGGAGVLRRPPSRNTTVGLRTHLREGSRSTSGQTRLHCAVDLFAEPQVSVASLRTPRASPQSRSCSRSVRTNCVLPALSYVLPPGVRQFPKGLEPTTSNPRA